MDPCQFVRILIGNLALKFPNSGSISSRSYYCKIKLKKLDPQIVSVPVISNNSESESDSRNPSIVSPSFTLSKIQIEKSIKSREPSVLSLEVYAGGGDGDDVGGTSCGISPAGDKLIGRFSLPLDLRSAESRALLVHNGWVGLGASKIGKRNGSESGSELHLSVRVEPDPRFVFQFDGEPECSPQVFLIQGNAKQAVFTCKFGFRNAGDRNQTPSYSTESGTIRSCLPSLTTGNDESTRSKERKGWSITIHDLSGSPVAMAAMVTPFVPSPGGSNRVSHSNPGAWLILQRDGATTWKPWARLEAFLKPPSICYRFHHFRTTLLSASSSITMKHGGKFVIDMSTMETATTTTSTTPVGSWDLGSGSSTASRPGSGSGSDFGLFFPQVPVSNGFMASVTVNGVEIKKKRKNVITELEVGVQHVTCTEDAAAYVALAAAVDLSVEACRPFNHKLRKELRPNCQEGVV